MAGLWIQSRKKTPVKLNSEQKELLIKFGGLMDKSAKKHSPNEESWIDNMKNFFEDLKP